MLEKPHQVSSGVSVYKLNADSTFICAELVISKDLGYQNKKLLKCHFEYQWIKYHNHNNNYVINMMKGTYSDSFIGVVKIFIRI